ncbi:serine/threonine-protein kinase [Zavarzinella formosa]|uniref:serine/threonine-protein kinase n=1 Tax=Zavarzinella formosa TaxID=360055 RepID=UPI000308B8A3|nr:serine/threonine-protein kinase [Zavarzinella formosa]
MTMLLGRYESLGVLGRGSMGEARAARPVDDPATTVVVKILRPDLADTPRARQFFERETQYTARLNHPYIVRLLDSGIDELAGPCLVLEFVPGSTLEQILRREPMLALPRVARLAGCLCHGLEAAHSSGVFHRDLKPGNLMIVNAGTPTEFLKIMDFGLAQLASKPFLSRESLSGIDQIVAQGTPAYISPDQLRGDDVDSRADIYATGVILYEMLTGAHPFPYPTSEAVMNAHLRERPPRFAERNVRHLPAALETVVLRCLAKYAPERPASARELAIELSRAVGFDIWETMIPLEEREAQAALPVAEDVFPDTPPLDPWHVVHRAEAWMPDRIAVLKLGGFLKDQQADLLHTEPGLLQARFHVNVPATSFFGRLFKATRREGVDLDVHLDRPNPTENRLILSLNFRPTGGKIPDDRAGYFRRCEHLFDEIRKYLM